MKKRIVALLLALILTVGLLPVSALAEDATEAPAAPQASDTEYITDVNTGGEENPVDSELPVAQDADPVYAYAYVQTFHRTGATVKAVTVDDAAQKRLGFGYSQNDQTWFALGRFRSTRVLALDNSKQYAKDETPETIAAITAEMNDGLTLYQGKDPVRSTTFTNHTISKINWYKISWQYNRLGLYDDTNDPDGQGADGSRSWHFDGSLYFYKVEFKPGADDNSVTGLPSDGYFLDGEQISDIPSRSGYKFTGWKASTDGTDGSIHQAPYTVTSDVTLTAQWELNPPDIDNGLGDVVVKVECVDNLGHPANHFGIPVHPGTAPYYTVNSFEQKEDGYYYSITINEAAYISLYNATSLKDVDMTGHVAVEGSSGLTVTWKWDDTTSRWVCQNEVLVPEGTDDAPADVVVCIKVGHRHVVSFDSQGGTPVDSQTVRHNLTASKPTDPEKSGYKFLGWYLDDQAYDFDTPVTEDITLTAQWTPATEIGDIMDLYALYDVQHIKQQPDGEYDVAGAEIEHRYAKLGTSVSATPKDYGSHYSVNAEKSTMTGTAIKPTLEGEKAVYTVLQVYYDLDFHTLTFDPNGGSAVSPDAITVRHGTRVTDGPLLPPFRAGYNFTGWYEDLACTTPFGFDIVLTEDKTVYAGWTPASPIVPTVPVLPVKPQPAKPALNKDDHYAYVIGYPDGTVHPNGSITRAEATTIFFRLLTDASREQYWATTNPYSDVNAGSWYNNAISTLSNAGIVDGYPDGTFRPDAPITRAEMAKLITAFARLSKSESRFNDIAGHWAETSIKLAAGNGWIEGYPDGSFRPQQDITRAETVTMVNRVLERVPAYESRLLPHDRMLTFPDCQPGQWFYIAMQEATNSHNYERAVTETKGDEQWLALRANRDWRLLER